MNYKKHYDLLCKRGQVKREGYVERHHIVPRCKGGDDSESNLTWLTAKEHYIAHYLLHMMDPKDNQLWYALFGMAFLINEHQQRYHIGSRVYQRLKEEKSEIAKQNYRQNLKNLEKAILAVKGKKRDAQWNKRATDAWIKKKGKGSAMKKEDLEEIMKRNNGMPTRAAKELGWSTPTVITGCRYHSIDYKQWKK